MREIKFRAWSKPEKIMVNVGAIFFETGGNIKGFFPKGGEIFSHHANHILMQFTGLKDKNGKEIYEGDVVRVDKENLVVRFVEKRNTNSSGFFFLHPERGLYAGIGTKEVIGNIYENPALLSK